MCGQHGEPVTWTMGGMEGLGCWVMLRRMTRPTRSVQAWVMGHVLLTPCIAVLDLWRLRRSSVRHVAIPLSPLYTCKYPAATTPCSSYQPADMASVRSLQADQEARGGPVVGSRKRTAVQHRVWHLPRNRVPCTGALPSKRPSRHIITSRSL